MLRQQIIDNTLLHIPTTATVLTNALCLLGLLLCFALAAVGTTVYFVGAESDDKAMVLPQTQVQQQTSLLPTTMTPVLPTTTTTTTTIATTCRVQAQQAPIPQAPRRASSCNVNLPRSAVAAF